MKSKSVSQSVSRSEVGRRPPGAPSGSDSLTHLPSDSLRKAPSAQQQFNALPLLARRREVLWLGRADLRCLVEEQVVTTVQVWARGSAQHGSGLYYVKASLAPVLQLTMDWEEFRKWPLLLRWSHLLAAGLREPDIPRLLQSGKLTQRASAKGYAHYHKEALAALVGYE